MVIKNIYFTLLGDISRCFKQKELSVLFSNIQILGGVATVLAPSSFILFNKVDFNLFGLHVNKYNFIGIFMAIIMILYTIGCFFFFPNLTKHPGYHIYLSKIKKKKKRSPSSEIQEQNNTSILNLLQNGDILLIMSGSMLCGFVVTETEITINLVAMDIFKWNLSFLSVVSLCCAIAAIVFMKFIQRFKGTVNIFFMFVMAVVLNNVSVCLQLLTIHAKFKTHIVIQVAVMFFFNFTNVICGYNVTSWARYILFSLVPPHVASTVDGYRFLFAKTGFCFGFFMASYIFRDGFYGYLVINATCMLTYFGLLSHKKNITAKSR